MDNVVLGSSFIENLALAFVEYKNQQQQQHGANSKGPLLSAFASHSHHPEPVPCSTSGSSAGAAATDPGPPPAGSKLFKKDSLAVYLDWVGAHKPSSRLFKSMPTLNDTLLLLRCEHWLEAADEKHRYGSNLRVYFDHWVRQVSGEEDSIDRLQGAARDKYIDSMLNDGRGDAGQPPPGSSAAQASGTTTCADATGGPAASDVAGLKGGGRGGVEDGRLATGLAAAGPAAAAAPVAGKGGAPGGTAGACDGMPHTAGGGAVKDKSKEPAGGWQKVLEAVAASTIMQHKSAAGVAARSAASASVPRHVSGRGARSGFGSRSLDVRQRLEASMGASGVPGDASERNCSGTDRLGPPAIAGDASAPRQSSSSVPNTPLLSFHREGLPHSNSHSSFDPTDPRLRPTESVTPSDQPPESSCGALVNGASDDEGEGPHGQRGCSSVAGDSFAGDSATGDAGEAGYGGDVSDSACEASGTSGEGHSLLCTPALQACSSQQQQQQQQQQHPATPLAVGEAAAWLCCQPIVAASPLGEALQCGRRTSPSQQLQQQQPEPSQPASSHFFHTSHTSRTLPLPQLPCSPSLLGRELAAAGDGGGILGRFEQLQLQQRMHGDNPSHSQPGFQSQPQDIPPRPGFQHTQGPSYPLHPHHPIFPPGSFARPGQSIGPDAPPISASHQGHSSHDLSNDRVGSLQWSQPPTPCGPQQSLQRWKVQSNSLRRVPPPDGGTQHDDVLAGDSEEEDGGAGFLGALDEEDEGLFGSMHEDTDRHNFFLWLDYGEGRGLDLAEQGVPREKLERECVRYLSSEELQGYEVVVDKDSGLLKYKKSGLILHTFGSEGATGVEQGGVPAGTAGAGEGGGGGEGAEPARGGAATATTTATAAAVAAAPTLAATAAADSSTPALTGAAATAANAASAVAAAPGGDPHHGSGVAKKWIWVVSPQGQLYVAPKVRGQFHHSSFLRGALVMAAGNMAVSHGQLVKLTADSGHYWPQPDHFKWFFEHLSAQGADLTMLGEMEFRTKH